MVVAEGILSLVKLRRWDSNKVVIIQIQSEDRLTDTIELSA